MLWSTPPTSTRCVRRYGQRVADDRGAPNGSATAKSVRILLVRLDGLGDTLACIPALEGLRRVYPDATFGAVLSPANAGVFSDRIEHVYEYDLRRANDSDAVGVEARMRDAHYT